MPEVLPIVYFPNTYPFDSYGAALLYGTYKLPKEIAEIKKGNQKNRVKHA